MFKLPKATKFHYTPRYYNGVEGENAYKMKSKYRKDDNSTNYNDFKGQWQLDRKAMRTRANYEINFRLVIIVVVLILLFLFLIDFDLSIFKKQ